MNHDSSLPLASPTPSALLDLQFVARRNDPSRVLAASFVPFDYLAQLYRVPSLDSPWHSAEVVQPGSRSNKHPARQLAVYSVACSSRLAHSRWETRLTAPFQPRAHSTGPSENRDILLPGPPRFPDRLGNTSHVPSTPGFHLPFSKPVGFSCR